MCSIARWAIAVDGGGIAVAETISERAVKERNASRAEAFEEIASARF